MKRNKLAVTLALLTIGLMGATANAQYRPAPDHPNVVDKRRPIARQPDIRSVPAKAMSGEQLTITGRWLPTRAWLQLGAKRIRPIAATPSRLTYAIPADLAARTYRARLIWKGHTENLGRIAIEPAYHAPIIEDVPRTVTLGKRMTITGHHLPAGALLKLGGVTLRPRHATSHELTFVIPARLAARSYRAKLVAGAYTKNLGRITLVAPYYAPVVTSAPNKAVLGGKLVITGRHLPASAVLKIGSKLLEPTYATPRRLTFAVPAHLRAWTYSMKLLMPNGNKNLGRIRLERPYYRPVVTWSPRSVTKGNTVTISGRHLPANAVLEIGNVKLRAYWASATTLKFKVPSYLRNGRFRMKLVTPRYTQSLGLVRVYSPRRRYWSFNFSSWFNFGIGS